MANELTPEALPANLPAVLQVQGLCFAYPQREVFAGWDGSIPPGVTLLQGEDGCGKTTLLRLLAADLVPQAGELRLRGTSLRLQPEAYRQQVFWADPWLQAFEQHTPADYFALQRKRCADFDPGLLADLVEALRLEPHLGKALYMLSTGSRRKVWLAAAFASGAAVTLLDEPFAALDHASAACVREFLQEAAQHPSRAWVVAHHAAPGELPLATHLLLKNPDQL